MAAIQKRIEGIINNIFLGHFRAAESHLVLFF